MKLGTMALGLFISLALTVSAQAEVKKKKPSRGIASMAAPYAPSYSKLSTKSYDLGSNWAYAPHDNPLMKSPEPAFSLFGDTTSRHTQILENSAPTFRESLFTR